MTNERSFGTSLGNRQSLPRSSSQTTERGKPPLHKRRSSFTLLSSQQKNEKSMAPKNFRFTKVKLLEKDVMATQNPSAHEKENSHLPSYSRNGVIMDADSDSVTPRMNNRMKRESAEITNNSRKKSDAGKRPRKTSKTSKKQPNAKDGEIEMLQRVKKEQAVIGRSHKQAPIRGYPNSSNPVNKAVTIPPLVKASRLGVKLAHASDIKHPLKNRVNEVDSEMDCSSDEDSLGLSSEDISPPWERRDEGKEIKSFEGIAEYNSRDGNCNSASKLSIVTKGMMERAMKGHVDNRDIIAAMLASGHESEDDPSPIVDEIVGGHSLKQSASAEESDISMMTFTEAKTKRETKMKLKTENYPEQGIITETKEKEFANPESASKYSLDSNQARRLPYSSAATVIMDHPPLPSGWIVRLSRSKNKFYYCHPDFGTTWHCPIVLPQELRPKKSLNTSKSYNMPTAIPQAVKSEMFKSDEIEAIPGLPCNRYETSNEPTTEMHPSPTTTNESSLSSESPVGATDSSHTKQDKEDELSNVSDMNSLKHENVRFLSSDRDHEEEMEMVASIGHTKSRHNEGYYHYNEGSDNSCAALRSLEISDSSSRNFKRNGEKSQDRLGFIETDSEASNDDVDDHTVIEKDDCPSPFAEDEQQSGANRVVPHVNTGTYHDGEGEYHLSDEEESVYPTNGQSDAVVSSEDATVNQITDAFHGDHPCREDEGFENYEDPSDMEDERASTTASLSISSEDELENDGFKMNELKLDDPDEAKHQELRDDKRISNSVDPVCSLQMLDVLLAKHSCPSYFLTERRRLRAKENSLYSSLISSATKLQFD